MSVAVSYTHLDVYKRQLFQTLVVGGDVEAVEDSPVQIKPHVHGLIEYTILFDNTAIRCLLPRSAQNAHRLLGRRWQGRAR